MQYKIACIPLSAGGLKLLPDFEKEGRDRTLSFRGVLVGKKRRPF